MRFSELWLREWANPKLTREQLCERLTLSGFEVESMTPEKNDFVWDVSITPNRGDCLSILGMAREVSAQTECKLVLQPIKEISAAITDKLIVEIKAPEECPRYLGRIIRGVNTNAMTPAWMQERLTAGDIKIINPVVDVMNYVMLELGQPMHAFDLAQIQDCINVRMAKAGEKLKLLDGKEVELIANTLIIADAKNPLAIAGVMGGLDSGVTLLTKDIFLESAFFTNMAVARSARQYTILSDSSYRFERGVDIYLQKKAIERATELLLEIVGGKAGPVIEVAEKKYLPEPSTINLLENRVEKILGMQISSQKIAELLERLGFSLKKMEGGWQVTVPSYRTDVTLDVDLIEEVIRLYGYEKLLTTATSAELKENLPAEDKIPLARFRKSLTDLGYNEVITYSFVDQESQKMFDPELKAQALVNPITEDMSVMRTSLWPGLVKILLYNQNRQQDRLKIFESGLRFIVEPDGKIFQQAVISGLIQGNAFPEQWGISSRSVDFYDLKGDLQNLFALTHSADEFTFKATTYPALHPGQTAQIYRKDQLVGLMGALHPTILQNLKIEGKVFLFELAQDLLAHARIPHFHEISKFPEIRRDIAIIVEQKLAYKTIKDTLMGVGGELLQAVNIFDVYQGKGIPVGYKSIALSLTLQHSSRTLVDEEVADLVERVILLLKEKFSAELRG